MEVMVGLVGFEPTTSCSQSRRAAKLRHSPIGTHSKPARTGRRYASGPSISVWRGVADSWYKIMSRFPGASSSRLSALGATAFRPWVAHEQSS